MAHPMAKLTNEQKERLKDPKVAMRLRIMRPLAQAVRKAKAQRLRGTTQ
jgi:hypothetical protein